MGWCANALQDAAKAFESAILNGAPPEQAARMQFESNRNEPEWKMLKDLGDDIVDQRRQGFAVTMGHIAEICHNNLGFSPILDSIKITMNDPSYIQKLEAANDLALAPSAPTPKGLAPKGLAPKGPAPKGLNLDGPAPTPSAPIPSTPIPAAAPSLGGNNRAAQINRQRQLAAQKQREDQGSGDTRQ